MRLKSLEIVGFKSFLEPTAITFAPGVTAVVGPNGCGKSNIVDAIRWVLGEQAPTRLRGKATEDLIYAGNDKNPAAGMAEVTLVLEAQDERPLPEPFAALSEVAVTRRVFRSGDAEYLINKQGCRLKDITELFLASQIHSRGYAIIEQGKIEEIIHAKPTELRTLVEEAAGLALFKGRRELSERKLERVRENLSRLNDVISEIERQLAYARRQAKKAETYKAIKIEADELERLSAARRLLEQRAEFDLQARRADDLSAAADTARARSEELHRSWEQARTQEQGAADQLAAAERDLESIRTSAQQRGETRRFIARRLAAANELQPQLSDRIVQSEARATAARAARAELGARLARERSANDGSEADLVALKEAYETAAAELEGKEGAAEEIKDELTELMREAAVIRGRLSDLAGERTTLEEALAVRGGAGEEAAERLAAAGERLKQALAELESARARTTEQEGTQTAAAEAELEARAARERAAAVLKSAREVLTAATARVERLRRSEAGERLRVVLDSLNGDRPTQTPRFVQEVIRAPRELEPALRAVLGEQMSSVIVATPAFAVRAIEILKEARAGRLSFVPEAVQAGPVHAISAPGIGGRLLDMVSVQPGFEPVAAALLGHVLVAEDLSSALGAANLNGHGTVFVTREGDVVWPERAISGGSIGDPRADDAGEVVLSVEEAQAAAAEAESQERAAADRLQQVRAAREAVNAELSARRRRVSETERAVADRRSELARLEREMALAQARYEGAARRLTEIDGLAPEANDRLRELAMAEQGARERLFSLKQDLAERKAKADLLGERMLELASRVESRKAKLAGLAQELRQVALRADELEGQIERDREAIRKAGAEKAEFEAELVRLGEQEEAARAREAELNRLAAASREQRRKLSGEAAAAREAANAALAEVTRLEQESVDCRLRRERASALCQELTHSFGEKFAVDFDVVVEELAQALSGRDRTADEERLGELRGRLARMGEVNLAAESEVAELEERAAALGAQREDMEKAMRDLSQTMQRLNREARQRFAETFEAAARNFSEVFPKLVRGGKARLELMEAQDLLEAGVNILVQPPGKKVKDISLLSGGEKALSALALVFSLFLLNPSPFCLLDEVDAPLDEFSVSAFTGLIQDLKARSQFIVITHNQRTMRSADQIHGVTMDQPGVSRIISLKLPEAA